MSHRASMSRVLDVCTRKVANLNRPHGTNVLNTVRTIIIVTSTTSRVIT
jgi:predicted P-loop ATPase